MIDPNLKLTVLHDDDSVFTEHTNYMVDYLSNPVTLTLTTADYLYFGYKKPFNATYFEFNTPSVNPAGMLVEYYDGTSWVSADYHDETDGLVRSGLVTWDKSSMSEVSVNSISKYYVRISLDVDSSAMIINGANIVFSEDADLKQEFFEISDPDFLPAGFSSHIPKHVAARNEIMQLLKNRGNQVGTTTQEDINPFDLHDVFQVRQAATYLTLSKIFFQLSDNVEDHWFRKFEEYNKKYNSAISLYSFDYDSDGDGQESTQENSNKYKVVRLNR